MNGGRPFPAKFVSRHALCVVACHRFSDRFDAGVTWTYNSGFRITKPLEYYDLPSALPGGERPLGTAPVFHFDRPNNVKTPDYHRLDLSLNFHRKRRRGVSTWSVYAYNAYCRMNVVSVEHDLMYTGPVPVSRMYFYNVAGVPIIPSFSYTFTF